MKISFKGINFNYSGKEKVLDNLNLELESNAINLIVGQSGCGKSTLLSLITGIIPDYYKGKLTGEMLFNENVQEFGNITDKSYEIGIMFQDPNSQFCTFKVSEELSFGLENMLVSNEEIDSRVSQVASFFDIEDLLDCELEKLSGGEKQLVALASIYIMKPKVILLDEPTANLDPCNREKVFNLLNEIKAQGVTIVIVEHNIDEIYDIVDNVYLLDKGSCLFSGTKEEANKFFLNNNLSIVVPYNIHIMKYFDISSPYLTNFEDIVAYLKSNQLAYQLPFNSKVIDGDILYDVAKISVSYGEKRVLDEVSFNINKGDFLAILGRNGAGKSTLLNVMLRILKVADGTVIFDNKEITKYKNKEFWKRVGVSFQNPEWQFVKNSVEDEMKYVLKKTKISNEEKTTRINDILTKLKLEKYLKTNPFLLSQGEKRRLSVALLLLEDKDILFFDEPTFGQDSYNKYELMELLKDLNNDGMTIVVISHDLDLVYEYCNRAIILESGKIILDGKPRDVFKNSEILKQANLKIPFKVEVSNLSKNI